MKRMFSRTAIVLLCLWLAVQSVSAAKFLVPGGQVIGLQLADNTVTVAAFDESLGQAARDAGLQIGDRIVSVDAQTIHTLEDIRSALLCSDGTVDVSILRDGKAKKLHVQPPITDDGPRLGVYLREGITGIGTITWYDSDTGAFGALGHGVSNPKGELVDMQTGSAFAASVVSVRKGQCGEPGQLMGTLTARKPMGVLKKNTVRGVFGSLDAPVSGEAMPVGSQEEIRTGPAVIRSTVNGSQLQEYSVEILKIYPNAPAAGRNLLLKVTDSRLLETTGGIVQGMGVSYNKDNQWNP